MTGRTLLAGALVIALVAAAFAYVTGIVAVRLLGPKVASFVALTEVLFAVLFAWVVLAELPAPVQLVGGALIVGGVIAVRADESRRKPRPEGGPTSRTESGSESHSKPRPESRPESRTKPVAP